MDQRFVESITQFVEDIIPKLEQYRQKNVNKYHREKEAVDCEYVKTERYKNRVRQVDILLPALNVFLKNMGRVKKDIEREDQSIL